LGLASFGAFLFGIAGAGRPGGFSNGQFDMSFLYVAGRCLRAGVICRVQPGSASPSKRVLSYGLSP
jgi:hypothetical protein